MRSKQQLNNDLRVRFHQLLHDYNELTKEFPELIKEISEGYSDTQSSNYRVNRKELRLPDCNENPSDCSVTINYRIQRHDSDQVSRSGGSATSVRSGRSKTSLKSARSRSSLKSTKSSTQCPCPCHKTCDSIDAKPRKAGQAPRPRQGRVASGREHSSNPRSEKQCSKCRKDETCFCPAETVKCSRCKGSQRTQPRSIPGDASMKSLPYCTPCPSSSMINSGKSGCYCNVPPPPIRLPPTSSKPSSHQPAMRSSIKGSTQCPYRELKPQPVTPRENYQGRSEQQNLAQSPTSSRYPPVESDWKIKDPVSTSPTTPRRHRTTPGPDDRSKQPGMSYRQGQPTRLGTSRHQIKSPEASNKCCCYAQEVVMLKPSQRIATDSSQMKKVSYPTNKSEKIKPIIKCGCGSTGQSTDRKVVFAPCPSWGKYGDCKCKNC